MGPIALSERRIVLHIGFHKTGTSSIQNVFHAHRKRLLSDWGILYPSLNANLSGEFKCIFRGTGRRVAPRGYGDLPLRRGVRQALEDEILQADWRALVLSAEALCAFPLQKVAEVKSWLAQFSANVEVIAVVREPGSWAASAMQQRLKSGSTFDWDAPSFHLPHYRERLSRYIEIFGLDRVDVVSLPSAVTGEGGLIGEFCRRAGLPAQVALEAEQAPQDNASLTQAGAEVLDAMNRREPMYIDGSRNPRRPPEEMRYVDMLPGPKFRLPANVIAAVRDECAEDVEWLRTAFGVEIGHVSALESDEHPGGTVAGASEQSLAPNIAAAIADIIVASNSAAPLSFGGQPAAARQAAELA